MGKEAQQSCECGRLQSRLHVAEIVGKPIE